MSENKTGRFEMRMTPDVREKLDKLAKDENRTASNWIVAKILDEYNKKAGA